MLMCAYCLTKIAKEEAAAGLEETTITVAGGDSWAAITVVDGDALCLAHWSERIRNIAEGEALTINQPGWQARLAVGGN